MKVAQLDVRGFNCSAESTDAFVFAHIMDVLAKQQGSVADTVSSTFMYYLYMTVLNVE